MTELRVLADRLLELAPSELPSLTRVKPYAPVRAGEPRCGHGAPHPPEKYHYPPWSGDFNPYVRFRVSAGHWPNALGCSLDQSGIAGFSNNGLPACGYASNTGHWPRRLACPQSSLVLRTVASRYLACMAAGMHTGLTRVKCLLQTGPVRQPMERQAAG